MAISAIKRIKFPNTWRTQQLNIAGLRSLMREYVPFWQVTGEALDFALAEADMENTAFRKKLINLYLQLSCYPEVPEMLKTLKDNGLRTGILSNDSREMLDSAVENSALNSALDASLSVDDVGVFKIPSGLRNGDGPIFVRALQRNCFMSSNAWDAWAASHLASKLRG